MSELEGAPDQNDSRMKLSNPCYWIDERIQAMEDSDQAWMSRRSEIVELLKSAREKGRWFPRERLEAWKETGVITGRQVEKYSQKRPNPGAVGLVYERDNDRGWVVPLSAEQLEEEETGKRSVSEHLPVTGHRLSSILGRTVDILMTNDPTGGEIGLPETLSFTVKGGIGHSIEGRSMDLAAVMAVLGATRSVPDPRLRAVTSIARPVEGSSEVRAVEGTEKKLEAFHREFGEGSLLIRTSETEAWDGGFEEVWEVDSLESFGEYLLDADLLDAVFESHELDEFDLKDLNRRLEVLVNRKHDYKAALNLYNRMVRCQFSSAISLEVQQRPHILAAEAARHLGKMDDDELHNSVVESAKEDLKDQRGSREKVVQLLARKAAQFYDRHEFERTIDILEDLKVEFDKGNENWNYQTQVEVFNTLARAYVAVGRDGWREMHERMMNLQKDADPKSVSRTRNYLIHGFLQQGTDEAVEEAESLIAEGMGDDFATAASNAFLDFYRAELVRQRGQLLEVERAEERAYGGVHIPHASAFYFQATARQPGRELQNALERFEKAKHFLSPGDDEPDPNSVPMWLSHCLDLGIAGWAEDQEAWMDARVSLREFAERSSPGVQDYYADDLEGLAVEPSREAADQFLETVPYF